MEPLYTIEDAENVKQYVTTCEYGEDVELCEGVSVRFADAGHLLGSACITVTATENGVTKKLIFSGDLGNVDQPIIRDPSHFGGADYVIMESTYGNRNHTEVWSYTEDLAKIIDETMAKGGNVVIPAFAVGRTQELLYFIREIKDKQLVKSNPDFPVYIDSPLARRATTIFTGDLDGYLDADALALVQDGTHMFNFSNLRMTETVEESKALNEDGIPKVIISASGMCDAGRIRHHLKHNLWKPECTVVFVGYQGEGTLGRSLLEGAKSVKLFGEEIAVHAKIVNFQGLSSHADRDHLLAWIADIKAPKPQHVFIVHGDREVAPYFAESVEKLGFTAHAPQYTEVYDLIEDQDRGARLSAGAEGQGCGRPAGQLRLRASGGAGSAAGGRHPPLQGPGQQDPWPLGGSAAAAAGQVGGILIEYTYPQGTPHGSGGDAPAAVRSRLVSHQKRIGSSGAGNPNRSFPYTSIPALRNREPSEFN